jgi:CubicO group peptidase (beta-lactamase class C family)
MAYRAAPTAQAGLYQRQAGPQERQQRAVHHQTIATGLAGPARHGVGIRHEHGCAGTRGGSGERPDPGRIHAAAHHHPAAAARHGISRARQRSRARGLASQPEGPQLQLPPVPPVTQAMAFQSGGGGMVSTISDYARLCLFWRNGGQLDGVRLLSRKTVALMTANHLPAGVRMGPWPTSAPSCPRPMWARASAWACGTHGIRPEPRPAAWAISRGVASTARSSGSTRRKTCSPS